MSTDAALTSLRLSPLEQLRYAREILRLESDAVAEAASETVQAKINRMRRQGAVVEKIHLAARHPLHGIDQPRRKDRVDRP